MPEPHSKPRPYERPAPSGSANPLAIAVAVSKLTLKDCKIGDDGTTRWDFIGGLFVTMRLNEAGGAHWYLGIDPETQSHAGS